MSYLYLCVMLSLLSMRALLSLQFWVIRYTFINIQFNLLIILKTLKQATVNVEHCFETNKEIFHSHNLTNSTDISDEIATKIYLDFNKTNPNETQAWGLVECSLEQMLSSVGEGTGLAFISKSLNIYLNSKLIFNENYQFSHKQLQSCPDKHYGQFYSSQCYWHQAQAHKLACWRECYV